MFRLVPPCFRQRPWPPTTVEAPEIDDDQLIQEENSSTPLSCYYPMRVGEVLGHRYQVTAKLGCGSRSTVWLARDLHRWRWQSAQYVSIKVTITSESEDSQIDLDELCLLDRITNTDKAHWNYSCVRSLLDHFYIRGPAGKHLCMVFTPLREPLGMAKYHWADEKISLALLKVIAQQLLGGLDYLHSQCQIIHCDISDNNVILSIAEEVRNKIPDDISKDERADPSPVKHLADRTLYSARHDFDPLYPNIGGIVITDFDQSVGGEGNWDRNHDCQPEGLTAPEVILRVGFSYSADIWNFGALLCGMVEGKPLFDDASRKEHGTQFSEALSFARMIAILGPPPQALLDRGERVAEFYDEEKRFKFPELVPKDCSFETFFTRVEGEDKEKLIAFAKRMLKWLPEERETAKELLGDEWMQ
ncbi:hypothetical protein LTR27_008904 [Elasticomyces elasticus]|nr:hypothetical protein LTR27_008904 [Elasticomyces elasticus]